VYQAKEKRRTGNNKFEKPKHYSSTQTFGQVLYNKRDIPWINLIWNTYYSKGKVPHATKDKVSFWWKDLLKLCDIYIGIDKCSVGDGTTVLFWSDIWSDQLLQDKFPILFSFAKKTSQYQ
jgi:hypothetical protein